MSTRLILSLLLSGLGVAIAATNSTNTSSNSTYLAPDSKGNPDAEAFSWKGEQWDNDFGAWSSFHIRVGSEQLSARVFPATNWQEVLVILPQACAKQDNHTTLRPCANSRGLTLNVTNSTTWRGADPDNDNLFELEFDNDLGFKGSGIYGYDTVAIDVEGTGMPSLDDQIVGGIINPSYNLGIFGLNEGVTNFTNYSDPQPGFLRSLWEKQLVPSKSWGYQAGAIYRNKGSLGRLVFGGYDSSRLIDNNVTFTQTWDSVDEYRHLVLSVQNITVNASTVANFSSVFPAKPPVRKASKNTTSVQTQLTGQALSTEGIFDALDSNSYLARIDSSTPYIFMPNATLERLVLFFGLSWDKNTSLYYFPDTPAGDATYKAAQSTSFTFTLSDDPQISNPSVSINLPFAAFDLQASAALAGKKLLDKRFVPFKGAEVESYTLGRSFMQEAYVIADFHRRTFKVHQAVFPITESEKLVNIRAPEDEYGPSHKPKPKPHDNSNEQTPQQKKKPLSGAELAGVVSVSLLGSIVLLLIAGLLIRRVRRKRALLRELKEKEDFVPELHGNAEWNEMHGEDALHQLEACCEPESPSIRRSKLAPINSEVLELPADAIRVRSVTPGGQTTIEEDSASHSSSSCRTSQTSSVSPEEGTVNRWWGSDAIISPQSEDIPAIRSWEAPPSWSIVDPLPQPQTAVARDTVTAGYLEPESRPDSRLSDSWHVQRPRPARINTNTGVATTPPPAINNDRSFREYMHGSLAGDRSSQSVHSVILYDDDDDEGDRLGLSWRPRGPSNQDYL